ncbi:AfsR/SARP family transcriptional regulator [Deinococcus planocerae]|uniref:AfsR/SARP family transcriptional regulator n=1 Tax=Deinococcus planocerae TaxID=1737569 RepID=UPI000C7F21D0|nr:BTAD domain-containing putative transcriptional regulator [Deinococcus planocerae]
MTHLQLFTLGQTSATLDGQPVHWGSSSAERLLHDLLSHPEGRRRDEILEDLWQTDLNEQSASRFRVTVHRLRRALESPDAVSEQHGRYVLSDEVLQASDVYRLYAALREGEQADDEKTCLHAYERVLDIYRGDFLEGCEDDWAVRAREEHRGVYVRACLELSALHCEHHECAASVETLSGALRADPYLGENHHQRLMGCLSTASDKYAAVEHYRRFVRFLRDELQDTPLPETTELAGRIKLGEHVCPRLEGHPPGQTSSCPFARQGRCPDRFIALEVQPPALTAPTAQAFPAPAR